MKRIGINALYLIPGGVGGTEVYLRELFAALAAIDIENQYFIFTNLETTDLVPKQANFIWKPQAVHGKNRAARLLWEQIILPLELSRFKIDVLLNPGFTAPAISPCPSVTVFHDLQHVHHPEYFKWPDLPAWRFFLWLSAHSRHLIAVSEATAKDVSEHYGIDPKRIAVIYHGAAPELFSLPRHQPEPFVLCVSTLHPHKNLERLIRVYGRTPKPYKLVLAGMRGFHTEAVEQLIEDMGLAERVQITGWISREELFSLYDRATGCIQPSTFEGFGMPVLEAMAAGVPLACSNIAPHREIAGGTARMFDPSSEDQMAAALNYLTEESDLRRDIPIYARERARAFTWEAAAGRTLQILLAIANGVAS